MKLIFQITTFALVATVAFVGAENELSREIGDCLVDIQNSNYELPAQVKSIARLVAEFEPDFEKLVSGSESPRDFIRNKLPKQNNPQKDCLEFAKSLLDLSKEVKCFRQLDLIEHKLVLASTDSEKVQDIVTATIGCQSLERQ